MGKFIRLRVLTLVGFSLLLGGAFVASRLARTSRAPSAPRLSQAQAIRYTYDGAGRLVRVDYGNGAAIAYTYDNGGNLLRREVMAGR